LACADLVCEAEALQAPQPTDLEGMEWVGLLAPLGCEIDDAMAVGIADKLAVEL
jgi:hypothetical protein